MTEAKTQLSPSGERRILIRLLHARPAEELDVLVQKGINYKVFTDICKECLEYIVSYYKEFRIVPTLTQFYTKFPDVGPALVPEKLADVPTTHVFELIEQHLAERSRQAVQVSLQNLVTAYKANVAPSKLIEDLSRTSRELTDVYIPVRNRYTDSGTGDVLIQTLGEEVFTNRALTGVPCPFLFLHERAGGFQFGEINTIAGSPGVGKSWLALLSLVTMITGDPLHFYSMLNLPADLSWFTEEQKALKATKVLMVSYEMTLVEMLRRLVPLLAKVSPARFTRQSLLDNEKKAVAEVVGRLRDPKDWGGRFKLVGPGEAPSPDAIDSLALDFGAKAVVLDAFYLMPSGKGDKRWERVEQNMERIRINSLSSGHVYILTTQLKREAGSIYNASLDSLAFSSTIGQDSNNVLFVDKVSERGGRFGEHSVLVRLVKARSMDPTEVYCYNMNHLEGGYTEVGLANDAMASSNGII